MGRGIPCRRLGGGGACVGITGSGRSTASENGAEPRNPKPATSNALVSNELSSRGEQSNLRDRESLVYSTELERVRTGRPGEAGVSSMEVDTLQCVVSSLTDLAEGADRFFFGGLAKL